jgi:hypothetical protein
MPLIRMDTDSIFRVCGRHNTSTPLSTWAPALTGLPRRTIGSFSNLLLCERIVHSTISQYTPDLEERSGMLGWAKEARTQHHDGQCVVWLFKDEWFALINIASPACKSAVYVVICVCRSWE